VAFWRDQRSLAAKAEELYGVPADIVVA